MNKEQILELILNFVCQKQINKIEASEVPRDESLLTTGFLDSFGVIELVDFLELELAIRIHDSDLTLENFGSIERMVEFLSGR